MSAHQKSEEILERIAYSVPDFCKIMSLGKTKVFAMLKEGRISSIKIDGRRLIPATEALRLLGREK